MRQSTYSSQQVDRKAARAEGQGRIFWHGGQITPPSRTADEKTDMESLIQHTSSCIPKVSTSPPAKSYCAVKPQRRIPASTLWRMDRTNLTCANCARRLILHLQAMGLLRQGAPAWQDVAADHRQPWISFSRRVDALRTVPLHLPNKLPAGGARRFPQDESLI